jgi:hypothetical protein
MLMYVEAKILAHILNEVHILIHLPKFHGESRQVFVEFLSFFVAFQLENFFHNIFHLLHFI